MPTMEADTMKLNASIMLATGVVGLALTGYSMLEGDEASAGLVFIGAAITFGSLAVTTRIRRRRAKAETSRESAS